MSHLVVDLLLCDRARALAHLLLHLVGGGFILLLQRLLLLTVLRTQAASAMCSGLQHCFTDMPKHAVAVKSLMQVAPGASKIAAHHTFKPATSEVFKWRGTAQ